MDVSLGVFEIIQMAVQHLQGQDSVTAKLVSPAPPADPLAVGIVPEVLLTGMLQPIGGATFATVGSQYEVILRPVAVVGR